VAIEAVLGMQTEYTNAVTLPSQLKNVGVRADQLDANQSPAVDATANIAIRMASVPANRSALEKMTAGDLDQTLVCPAWVSGNNYDKGDTVTVGAAAYTALNTLVPSTTSPATDTANWTPIAAIPAPIRVPIDGWGHGLRYVGSGGLSYLKVDPKGTKGWIGPSGAVPAGFTYMKDAVQAPNGRPFWVSAGPDGSFETEDDNVYSFRD